MTKSLRLVWLGRLLNRQSSFWRVYFLSYIKKFGGVFFLKCNYKTAHYNIQNVFYKELLNYWSQVQQIYSVEKYSNPVIWNNQDVLIGNEPVFYKSLLEAEILTTDDIKGLSIAQAVTHSKNNGEKNFNFLTLLALRTATKDVQGVLRNKLYFYDQENLFITNNEGEFKDVRNMKCKHFYDIFLSNLKEKPSKSLKLKSDYSLTDEDLQSIYLLPQKLTTETYMRSFQYKVLNGILYSRKFLLKFGLVEDDKCLEVSNWRPWNICYLNVMLSEIIGKNLKLFGILKVNLKFR